MRLRRPISIVALVALASCGHVKTWDDSSRVQIAGVVAHATDRRPVPHRVSVVVARSGPRPLPATRTIPALTPKQRAAFHRWIVGYWFRRWLDGLPPAIPAHLLSVAQCIKDHESGDYGEHSHPYSGSGAFQFVPGTWRHWSAAAGYPGYAFAYQAPANVQDAVLGWTLTHGGASNWSNRWGNDPCTAGL